MKSALEKILSYKVKDGRVTSQSDKEQWTCLQKIIAINKLIVDYHNAFVELKESYQDLLDRYNEINAEWDVLKTDMEAIATEWTQFKPLVQQIINLWENTITPTFEEWTTLMNNWGNTMNGYSDTMADYEQQMMNIQQEFNEIETAWGQITLAVRGNFTASEYTLTHNTSKYIDLQFETTNECYVIVNSGSNVSVKFYGWPAGSPVYINDKITSPTTMIVGMKYLGNFSELNALYQFIGISGNRGMFTDPTDTQIRLAIVNDGSETISATVYTRHVPYFSVDQSAEVQEAKSIANTALTTANTANTNAITAITGLEGTDATVAELQNRVFGQTILSFSDSAITRGNTKSFENISKNAWTWLTIIFTYNGIYYPMSIPLVCVPTLSPSSVSKVFSTNDDPGLYAELWYTINTDTINVKINNSSVGGVTISYIMVS